ncbi:MAG TPA: xanthine dehydrogenase family protein subunit M [Rhodocyclaceae bacterium]|nr:xanthine dehydrogenase family protein subunit M [Rhodocyclaceae bacterium]
MKETTTYLAPRSLNEAVEAMAAGDVTVFCGGTDLTPQTDSGVKQYGTKLMNIRRIEGLSGVADNGDTIRIGAATTVTDVRHNPLIAKAAPILAEAAERFASDQIRNAASVGGNICNASPAGDMINPLLVLDAAVELASWADGTVQTRSVPLEQFFVGPRKSVKKPEELLTAVVFKKPASDFVGKFRKSGPRPALEISTVSVGIGGNLSNGVFRNVRVAMGSVAPTPLRARNVEAALEGRPLNADSISAAVAAAAIDAKPIDDVRASAWYREHLVKVFTEEVLSHVHGN